MERFANIAALARGKTCQEPTDAYESEDVNVFLFPFAIDLALYRKDGGDVSGEDDMPVKS